MDKPRHPLVTRPWKIQQTQRTKCNLPPIKTGKEHGRVDSKPQRSFILRKPASRVPRRRSEIDTFRNYDNGNKKDVRTNALEFFGLTPLRARE
jgi:hypothetical protein